ncbi:RT0821/Lpp0805 family surface protein [Indioceanicola profundi]|uniref:RT0821/Lpp0805 family surface protein n=1 Tax=Indioceanicola profundi TaxID=2220096 RepID=UPI001CEDEA49|nr:RT0821/Lpp0805 family surface protein [Indioceanicola profundi]
MRMPARLTAVAAAAAMSLGACTQGQGPSNETLGTLGGAAGGAILGSQIGGGSGRTAATAIGAVLGALAGREIAQRMSSADQERAATAERTAVARNEAITWNNPDTGARGTIEPVRTYTNAEGNLCREYTHTVYIDGQPETARGTACRQDDGTWRLVA